MRRIFFKQLIIAIFLIATTFVSAFAQSSSLNQLQSATRSIANEVLPSVVTIDVMSTVEVQDSRGFFFFFDNPFSQNTPKKQPKRKFKQQGLGSGVIVRNKGDLYYVLTNAHVVKGSDEVTITTYSDKEFSADIVGIDAGRDLALLSFKSDAELIVADLGNSDLLQPGDLVFAVGNPYGFRSSITFGIISALNRQSKTLSKAGRLTNYIQTDAAVNRGNSGGPLVNINGQVIGINTWIYSEGGGGNEGLSFAVPINNAIASINDFIEKGRVDYAWLGVGIETVVPAQMVSLKTSQGVMVRGIYAGSPAWKAGIHPGDVIVSVDGDKVKTDQELINKIVPIEPGKKAVISLYRDGALLNLDVRLAERKEDTGNDTTFLWPGFNVMDITSSLSKRLGVPKNSGVVVTQVDPQSPAGTAGLQSGDVIERVNNNRIKSLREFYNALGNVNSKEDVLFKLVRNKTNLTIGIEKK